MHDSHKWSLEKENDFTYYMCVDCYTCSCCGEESDFKCPGPWDPEEENE